MPTALTGQIDIEKIEEGERKRKKIKIQSVEHISHSSKFDHLQVIQTLLI